MSTSSPRGAKSVKIPETERSGWSSERPRRPGEPERPPRPPDVSVRGRVLAPSDWLRYSPGSLLLVACPDPATRDAFCLRVLADQSVLLSLGKLRTLLRDKVPAEELDEKAQALLDGATAKRMEAGHTVVIALEGLDPEERERYVRLAAPHRRPRHLMLVEPGKEQVPDEDRAALSDVRSALDAGMLGGEGFMTSIRVGGRSITELKRVVFAPPPAQD